MKKSKRQQAFSRSAEKHAKDKAARSTMLPVQPAPIIVPQPSNEPLPRISVEIERGNEPPPIVDRDVKPENVELSSEATTLEAMAAQIRARRAP